MGEIVIASACRTAIGTFGGTLKDVPAAELGAIVVKEPSLPNRFLYMPIPLRYSLRTSNMIRKKPMGNILLLPCCVKMELPMQILVLST